MKRKKIPRVLIACEESQVVTKEFRKLGFNAFSCDTQECSGGRPEWHIQEDVIPLLKNKWDAVIAFPPCTHLCVSGAKWFEEKRKKGIQQKGIQFFLEFTKLKCLYAIENPVGIMSNIYRKPDQIIHPWQFGHGETKKTCLWLNGFPNLKPTKILYGKKNKKQRIFNLPPSKNRSKIRSKTYTGIAKAMADQWSQYIGENAKPYPKIKRLF